MAKPRGEPFSRELDKRIAPRLTNTAALQGCAIDSAYRNDGSLITLDDLSIWRYDIDSTAAASASVIVPTSGSGRWHNVVPAGGAGGNQYKATVRLATAGALAAYTRVGNVITANANGALGNLDGVLAAAGDRVLLTSAGTASDVDNGIYDITSVGGASAKYVLTRSSDADVSAEVLSGLLVFISEGTTLGNQWYFCTTDAPITLNTTALSFELVPTTGAITSLTTRVSTEESTRSTADASLTTRVSTEESTRSDADASLTTRVSTEESTRSDADASLTTRVSTEESTRSDAVTSIDTAFSTADASLTTRVSTEESTRSDADASLTTRVSTEESTRSDADASLTTRVSTEESTRSDADASLTTRVSTEESNRSDAVASVVAKTRAIVFNLHEFREVDANTDVGNLAAHGGILASDSTPVLEGGTNEAQRLRWATGNTDMIATNRSCPLDMDGSSDVTLRLWVSSGAVGPDAASFTVETGWDGAAYVSDAASDGAAGASVHEITATIAAADVPDTPDYFTMTLTPAAHANDPIDLHAVRMEYVGK